MAKIRNSMVPNTWGEGKEKIITMDNGDEFIVRNTMVPNTFGDGYEQEIVKRGSRAEKESYPNGFFLLGIIGIAYICGIMWLMTKAAGGDSAFLFYGTPILAIVVPIIILCIWSSSVDKKNKK